MTITDTLYLILILLGLFIIHFGIPVMLLWLSKVLICWACRTPVQPH